MKKAIVISLCISTLLSSSIETYALEPAAASEVIQETEVQEESFTEQEENEVAMVPREDTVYVKERAAVLREKPEEDAGVLQGVWLGEALRRTGVTSTGWSKVEYQAADTAVTGYVKNEVLGEESVLEVVDEENEVFFDCDVIDYPARKDGIVIGEILEGDDVHRTGIINDVWSRIEYTLENGVMTVGYVPTSVLEEEVIEAASAGKAGTLHKSSGTGIFADAVEGVTQVKDGEAVAGEDVQVGEPIAVSSSASLKPLGKFRITHYCACSICCGAYSNGYTATGTRATTNRTIAVNPSQIPYGSKVVINGQVFVAEDCGGAIVDNCIDVYVATHSEGLTKGTYYTDVYLLQE